MPRRNVAKSNKQKGTRRGKGMEQKKGAKGIAPNYITRTKAVKKLQITLKDFRRLCILKGIFPRDPKKKKAGADKTYYHVKDIKFLQHEPLLQKFRDFKIFMKKFKKAKMKHDEHRMEQLQKTQPEFTLDHLVKERYPQFLDALKDLDDAISMIYLFAALPAKTVPQHTPERAAMCLRLVAEWETYLVRTHTLKRIFVSIKGIYYQAEIMNTLITWLVPHKFTLITPTDVDYRVMLTFLQFYETLLKFVNFKLYHDQGWYYPPTLDEQKDAARAGLSSIHVTSLASQPRTTTTSTSSQPSSHIDTATSRALQKSVDQLVTTLEAQDEDMIPVVEEETPDDFEKLNGQSSAPKLVFDGLTFLISREVPQESLELVIRAGGGSVYFESAPIPEGTIITHQIIDRPTQRHRLLNREYVQPQWIYDSYNIKACVPVGPYGPGLAPPPHLSPFINDEAEGYVPKQRHILNQWRAAAAGEIIGPTPTASTDDPVTQIDTDLEQQYEHERAQEEKGIYGEQEEEEDEEEEDDDEDEQKEGDGEEQEDEQESSDEEHEEKQLKKAPAKQMNKRKTPSTITGAPVLSQDEENHELAKMMMGKKQKRAYQKITAAITHKTNRARNLQARADAAEAGVEYNKRKQKAKASPASHKSAKKAKIEK